MRYVVYSRPIIYNLSQGSRIRFIRCFRHLTQDNVSDDLGISGECKRRTMTRYETGSRMPSKERLKDLASILLTNINLIKQYDFKNKSDIIYFLLWLEELYPDLRIDLSTDDEMMNQFFYEWNSKRRKRENGQISYDKYLEWKITYKVEEN